MVVSAKQVKFHFLLCYPGRQASEIHGIWGTGTRCQMQQDVRLRGERAILYLHLHVTLDVSCRISKNKDASKTNVFVLACQTSNTDMSHLYSPYWVHKGWFSWQNRVGRSELIQASEVQYLTWNLGHNFKMISINPYSNSR